MSSWCDLRVGKLGFDSWSDEPLAILMSLYTESERRSGPIPPERWKEFFRVEPDQLEDERSDFLEYVAPAKTIAERLDFLGFTTEVSRRAFEIGRREQLQNKKETLANLERFTVSQSNHPEYLALVMQEISLLENELSPEAWINGLREIRDQCTSLVSARELRNDDQLPPLLRYMVQSPRELGFPGYLDPRFALRLMTEALETEDVVYDLSYLYLGEYIDLSDPIVEIAISLLSHEDRIARRVVVLTEGSTDTWALQRSIKLLAPDIADFFSFMDFEGARIEGGASALASIVKAFVATGIENRVLALFDNDTAGLAALRRLASIKFPTNIVALQYPPFWLARDYPTLGPNGLTSLDVNGMACSLELYLGMDVLKDEDSNLLPIHWRAFDSSVGQYQGEITDKKLVLERFSKKLDVCEQDQSRIADYDWSGLKLIIHAMKTAFHDVDAQTLLDREYQDVEENDSYEE